MSAPIGPGDWVECVDASACPAYGPTPLVVGLIYAVERIDGRADVVGGVALHLVGVRSGGPQGGFGAFRFRPVYRPRTDLIETLLQPVDGVKPSVDA